MRTFFGASNSSNVLTKPIFTTLICFFLVFLPYLIIWILAGEYNNGKSLVSFQLLNYTNGECKSISWQLYTIIFSIFGFNLFLPFILYGISLGKIKLDTTPFIYTLSIIAIMVFITWLIPYNNEPLKYLVAFGRIIIVVISGVITFFVTNKFSNYIIANSRLGLEFALAFKSKQLDEDQKREDIQKIKKKSKAREYIEIEEKKKGK